MLNFMSSENEAFKTELISHLLCFLSNADESKSNKSYQKHSSCIQEQFDTQICP